MNEIRHPFQNKYTFNPVRNSFCYSVKTLFSLFSSKMIFFQQRAAIAEQIIFFKKARNEIFFNELLWESFGSEAAIPFGLFMVNIHCPSPKILLIHFLTFLDHFFDVLAHLPLKLLLVKALDNSLEGRLLVLKLKRFHI